MTAAEVLEFDVEVTPPLPARHVDTVRGTEALGAPFEFAVDFHTLDEAPLADAAVAALLGAKATLLIPSGSSIAGIIARVDVHSGQGAAAVAYTALVVPSLWKLSLNRTTRGFANQKAPEIAKKLLLEAGMIEGTDFEFGLTKSYANREFTLQLDESDLQFFSRLLEQEGMFWFFKHTGAADKLSITDANTGFVNTPPTTIPYEPVLVGGAASSGISTLSRQRQLTAKTVRLASYNPTLVASPPDGTEQLYENGHGTVLQYGESLGTDAQADKLVKYRAAALRAASQCVSGTAAERTFYPGMRFLLAQHPVASMNVDYVLTRVKHEYVAPSGGSGGAITVHHEFSALPYAMEYRQALSTVRPRADHTLLGIVVHRPEAGENSPADEFGRYPVQLLVDRLGSPQGAATCWMRVAQLAAGAHHGFHVPLLPNTEVVVAFHDGNPDRPFVLTALANGDTFSPVRSGAQGNENQLVYRTPNGAEILVDDIL